LRGGDPLGYPCRGLALHPIQNFESSFEFVDMLDRAVRPFGFYLPMFAVFENYTKYRISRRHVSLTRT
jgi:hypothetical protein